MAWVRYDDQFHVNPKVTAVIAEDAAALALHVLANTWTNSQKRMGFVPRHQPGVLVCDRTQGTTWAKVLVRHGLWHDRDNDCAACREEYADLPDDVDGFVIHNAKEYRAPARERLTSGTAADLSEKRREAGRRGGLASAARRNQTNESKSQQTKAKRQASQADEAKEGPDASPRAAVAASGTNPQVQVQAAITPPAETQQVAQASQANGVSKTSNLLLAGVSPVPGTSPYGEVPPGPETLFASDEAKVPPTAGADAPAAESKPKTRNRKNATKAERSLADDQADELTNAYWERYETAQGWITIRQIVRTALVKISRDDVARALGLIGEEGGAVSGGAIQTALKQINLARGRQPGNTGASRAPSTTDQRVAAAVELSQRLAAREAAQDNNSPKGLPA